VTFDGTRATGVNDVPLNSTGDFPRLFNDVGTFKFHCTQHAGMTGQVTVN
jgi:plastocyanin